MKNKNYHTIGTIPKSNWKIVKRGKIDTCTPNTHTWPLTFLDRYRHFNKKWLRSTSFMGLSLPWCCHVCVFHIWVKFQTWVLILFLMISVLYWTNTLFWIGVVLHFVSDDLCFVLDQHTILDWCSATFCFWWSLYWTNTLFWIGVVLHFFL